MYFVSCNYRSDRHQGKSETTNADTILTNNQQSLAPIPKIETDTLPLHNDATTYSANPSAKELEELYNLISDRLGHMKDNPLQQNVWGVAILANSVQVSMAINSPYWQNEFRKNISSSPNIEFDGPSKLQPVSELVDSVTESATIKLRPDSSSFSVNSKYVTFTLTNDSKTNIDFGVKYIIGVKGSDNHWYKLPHPGIWNDMGIILMPTGKFQIKAAMNPKLNHNKSGTYRLYKQVRLDGEKDDMWLMTEFQLD